MHNKVAREVAKTKKTKKLDYMNPYERRIIHSALQNDKYVSTYSEGTDPYRRLVIEYNKIKLSLLWYIGGFIFAIYFI